MKVYVVDEGDKDTGFAPIGVSTTKEGAGQIVSGHIMRDFDDPDETRTWHLDTVRCYRITETDMEDPK